MPDSPERNAWVLRVLGVDVTSVSGPRVVDAGALLAEFLDAKEEVDAGLNRLAIALRATDDPDNQRISEFGLFGIGSGAAVRLLAALTDARSAAPEAQTNLIAVARKAAADYRAAVLSDGSTALIDANPYGVAVGLRTTLVQALAAIEHA